MAMERRILFGLMLTLPLLLAACVMPGNTGKTSNLSKYDIEQVFGDPEFRQVIEGDTTPKEVRYGLGGEQGYQQYSSKDPEMIQNYIDALRKCKIKEIITDRNDFIYVADAINDYTFVLDDGKEILISIDSNVYVTDVDNEMQYVLEYNEKLNEMNKKIASISDEQAVMAIKEYCYSQNPDLKKIEKDGEYPVYWEVSSSNEDEIVVLFRSYTGAQIRYYIDRTTGNTQITEFMPGISQDEEPMEETLNVRDYID